MEGVPSSAHQVLRAHEGAVLGVKFNRSGTYCMTCGKDRTLKLWNPYSGLLIKTYPGHGQEVRDVCISSDNSKFASVGGDRNIFYWDVATGRSIRRFRGHDSAVNCIAYNEECTALVSGGYDSSVRIWDCRSSSIDPIQVIGDFKDSVTSVVVTPRSIFAGSVDGTVSNYDIRMGLATSDQLGSPVVNIALSADSECMLAVCMDARVRVLDRQSGELLNQYKGHVNSNYKVGGLFSNTDAYVVCGSEDGRICFWDLVDAKIVKEFVGHKGVVSGLAYHPTDACMVSCSTDGTAIVWR